MHQIASVRAHRPAVAPSVPARRKLAGSQALPAESYAGAAAVSELPRGRPQFSTISKGQTRSAQAGQVMAALQAGLQTSPATATALVGPLSQVVHQGSVLTGARILKRDEYPGLHTASLQQGDNPQPRIPGAPNYRSLSGTAIQGTAQPTVPAIKQILERSGAGPGSTGPPALWVNLREEPFLYIKGRSYCLRDHSLPYQNLGATGILPRQLEQVEDALKRDVLQEASRCGGKVALTVEDPDGTVRDKWVEIKPEDVKTVKEVYRDLSAQGYRVDYQRIPVTDEKSPEVQDFDAMVGVLRGLPENCPRIFNCHAGRGRTTTAMVIADMLEQAKSSPLQSPALLQSERFQRHLRQEEGQEPVEALARALRSESAARPLVDRAIDRMGAVENLRKAILKRKPPGVAGPYASQDEALRIRSANFLDRYLMLIHFSRYLSEAVHDGFRESFGQWIAQHRELYDTMELAGKTLDTWHARQA